MRCLKSGQFTGDTFEKIDFDGVTATETEYDYRFIDWHYHENPYFSLTTLGVCQDKNRREAFVCNTDSLLFLNSGVPHSNEKTDVLTRGFQIELSNEWRGEFEIDLSRLPNSSLINDPNIKLRFYNVYKESKLADSSSKLTVDALLLDILDRLAGNESHARDTRPIWVPRIEEILRDGFDDQLTLQSIADELGIHRVHLSREFPRYFNCTFSEYLRRIRVEKALSLLRNKRYSLTEIGLLCGFADQSHFIRCFKDFHGITPKAFRRIISAR